MSLPPLLDSATLADSPAASSQPLPTSAPQAGMNNASPPAMPQRAPLASPPSPQIPARQVLPPSISPIANPPLPSVTPETSPPGITTPILAPPVPLSPPPPVKPAPPPEATASPLTHPFLPPESPTLPVHSPPPLPISPPPLLPTSIPPSPPPQPPIPPSQPLSTVSPPLVTPPVTIPSPRKVIPPPATTSPIVPPPTTPSKPPPAPPLSWVLPSPPPPSAMISWPPSSQLANRTSSMSSKEFHISVGLIVACAIGGFFLFLVLCHLYLCCEENRRRNSTIKQHDDRSTFLAPKDSSKNVQPQHSQNTGLHSGESVITVQTEAFPLPPPMASNARSGSTNSPALVNPLPPQAPRDAPFGLPNGGFTYDELVVATNGFSDANLLGQGGFGYVHKGLLPGGKEIAVKQLKEGSLQGKREFQAEVEIICRVHHKHLVSLVGYCINGAARLLVYEFVPNNTLEFHLHGSGQPVMEWGTRLKIAIGSAKGLSYLHEDCNPKIIHRDIKAANILLDHDFEAKVSDFGLAKSFSGSNTSSTHISTRVMGTFGYMAPEYALSGKLTDKSDVYSYGVVLLELITGRPPIRTTESVMNESLVPWARPLLTRALEDGNFEAVADPRLQTNYNTNQMARMVACAAACLHHSSWVRPRMSQVVHALQGGMSALDLNEGIFKPRHSTLYGSSRSSSSNTYEYVDYTKNFDMAMSNRQHGISGYTETTSEYGLNPSSSSSDNGP